MNNGYNRNGNERKIPQGQRPEMRQSPSREPGMRQGQPKRPVRPNPQNIQGRNTQDPGIQAGRRIPHENGNAPGKGQMGRPNQPNGNVSSGRTRPQSRPESDTRRKATKEQMRAENRRRRKEALGLFLNRLALYGILILVIGGIGAAVFFGFFYSTPDANKDAVTYFECYDGKYTSKLKVSDDTAYPDGVLYVNFSNIADGSDMTVILDSDNAKFVLPDGEDTSDSAGTGHEEYALFTAKSTECVVCGQPARLSAPAVFSGKNVWVPADFITDYVNGITVEEEKSSGKVYITRDTKGEGDKLEMAEVSFRLKATTAPENAVPDDELQTTGGMPELDFATDLSAFEEYMNPTDASEYLVLVNRTHVVDETYKPDDLTNIADTRKDGRETQKMRKCAAKALEALFIEMRAAGYTDVSVTSAYRSYEYQGQIYNDYTNKEMKNNSALTKEQAQAIVDTYSAKPGTSEHQTGLCCDMHNLSSADRAFADKPVYKWLNENAWKFGFILRFPEDKTEITGYDFEPWHYRFVGRNAAWQIKNGGMCLEEYLDR